MEGRETTAGAVVDEARPETEGLETGKKVHKVIFLNRLGEPITVEYEPGVTPYRGHGLEGSLLDIAINAGVDLQHACGGNCACTTCHVIVKAGEENLTPMDEDEDDRLYMADGLTLHSRLGCQAVVKGDVTVEIVE